MKRAPRGLVVVPARDEAQTLPGVLAGIFALPFALDVVVIDDGATDQTAEVARRAGAVVLTHPFWLGYGAALQTGFKYALSGGYAWVVTIDADGQHDPADIPALVAPVAQSAADISVGSRFLVDPAFPMGFAKRCGIWFFRGVFRALARRTITDPTSGFKCLSRAAYAFCARDLFPHDYPDTDMMITLQKAHFRIVERPAAMSPRRMGRSMHAGAAAQIYYAFKACVSILATVFRESHAYLGEPKGRTPAAPPAPAGSCEAARRSPRETAPA